MNENSNYIRVYEGYPEFMIDFQINKSSKLGSLKMTPWSLPINILDFYNSLTFINKFYAITRTCMTELVDVLKPHDNTLLALIEMKIYERAEVEFMRSRAFLEGELIEYVGHEYLEDETILGNSDKMNFYVKDLVAHLDKPVKEKINPYYIGKLDIETINFFDFP